MFVPNIMCDHYPQASLLTKVHRWRSTQSVKNWLVSSRLWAWSGAFSSSDTCCRSGLRLLALRHVRASGLVGILAAPFLHANLGHLINNTIPLTVLLLLLAGSKAQSWKIVVYIVLLSGTLLWLFGRPATHIGASGLIYGLVAYLILSGIREQRIVPMIISIVVGFLYGGTLASGLVPRLGSQVSWEGHLLGAIAGGVVAYVMTRDRDPMLAVL